MDTALGLGPNVVNILKGIVIRGWGGWGWTTWHLAATATQHLATTPSVVDQPKCCSYVNFAVMQKKPPKNKNGSLYSCAFFAS